MKQIVFKQHQTLFLRAPEQYVGLFGGVGNGKTFVAGCKCLDLVTQFSDNLVLIGRQTYPELRDSTREMFLSIVRMMYPKEAYQFNNSENSITFWNRSRVIFRHLDEPANLLSMNLGGFYIDQAEEVDEEVFLTLQSRLRRPNVGPLKGLVTGNPKGMNWIYYKFGLDKANGAGDWKHNEFYRMITAPTLANADNLPKDYIRQLQESYSPEWFARYVGGSWEAFEGQIFDITKVRSYDTLPEMAMIVTAIDPAISKEKSACNTAICTLGMGVDGYIYDIETIAGQWSFLETMDNIEGVLSRRKPKVLGVEDTAYQKALMEAAQASFGKHGNVEVVDLKADRDKWRRAKSVSMIVSRGLLRTNNRDLMNEMTAFDPDAKGKERKDRVDALVHGLHMIQTYAPVIPVKQKDDDVEPTWKPHKWFFDGARKQAWEEIEGISEKEERYDLGYGGPKSNEFY